MIEEIGPGFLATTQTLGFFLSLLGFALEDIERGGSHGGLQWERGRPRFHGAATAERRGASRARKGIGRVSAARRGRSTTTCDGHAAAEEGGHEQQGCWPRRRGSGGSLFPFLGQSLENGDLNGWGRWYCAAMAEGFFCN
ncbi:putative ATP-dependent RNA helicase DDX54 [Sesbania bispinosa]|nr:putative ATP-dependent RNA helicase DDX54 [Sesbania bispinosa]